MWDSGSISSGTILGVGSCDPACMCEIVSGSSVSGTMIVRGVVGDAAEWRLSSAVAKVAFVRELARDSVRGKEL